MKKKLLITVLIVIGIAGITGQVWLSRTLHNRRQTQADLAPYRTTILVDTNEAILFRNPKGVGVAAFDQVGHVDTRYRFRALAPGTNIETDDVVDVHHAAINLGLIAFDTSDPKSHYIRAGAVWIAWSYHNPGEAWVTYHSNLTEVAVVPADRFSDIDLMELRDKGVQAFQRTPLPLRR